MSVKQCSFCRAEIPEVALKCPECGKRIAGAGSPEEFRRRMLKAELVLRGALRKRSFPDVRAMGGRLRVRTVLAAVLPPVAGGLALVGYLQPEGVPLKTWDWVLLIAAMLLSAYFISVLVDDLALPSASGRTDPARGMKAFLQALKLKRYSYAYNCLLPGERNNRPRRRYAVQTIGTRSGKFSFADLRGFRAYWHPLFHPASAEAAMDFSDLEVVHQGEDFAVVAAKLSATREAGGWGGGLLGFAVRRLMSKEQEVKIGKLLRRVDGQWYLVNGEVFGPEDEALEQIAELAAAEDSELVELSKAGGEAR